MIYLKHEHNLAYAKPGIGTTKVDLCQNIKLKKNQLFTTLHSTNIAQNMTYYPK